MKVLFYNHTGRVSGAERVLLLALTSLDKDLIQPTLVAPGGDLAREAADIGVPCLEIGELNARFTIRPDKLIRYTASLIGTVLDLRSKIAESDPDVIHANSIRAGIAALFATHGTKRPVIWHVHDELKTHPLSTAIRVLVRRSKRCRVVAVSKATAASFAGRFWKTANITVVHNAVDLNKIDAVSSPRKLKDQFGFGDDDFLFGIVGQITPRKGQLELIRAFASSVERMPAAKLLIVGAPIFNDDHLYQEKLVETARALGIEDRVLFLGQRSDAIAIMKELDALVINSSSEAFVMVAIEAMACGTPVIATDVGGMREMIEHQYSGLLVDFGDEKHLIYAMTTIYADGRRRQLFADRGREKVEKHLNAERFTNEFHGVLFAADAIRTPLGVRPRLDAGAYENR